MRIAIRHSTHYVFDVQPVHGLKRLRLMPKTTHGQRVLTWNMACTGAVVEAEYDDGHNNHTTLLSIEPGSSDISISCQGVIETADSAGVVGPHTGFMPLWMFLNPTVLTHPGPKIRALAGRFAAEGADRLETLHALAAAVLDGMAYTTGSTSVTTTGEEALVAGSGVCQDHDHAFIATARLIGVPERYDSG